MADATGQWLTTGGVARLCSVRPDTVQKWIRKGRIPAQRTAGGHYRVALSDIEPFIAGPAQPRWYRAPPAECRPQPLRCWEYLSDGGTPREECMKCVVYRVRAAWCLHVLDCVDGKGSSRRFCTDQGSCEECLYYRRICGAPWRVLVVTADEELVRLLTNQDHGGLSLAFASNAYRTSAMIGATRPDLVILDEDLCDRSEPDLLRDLLDEQRVPGLKIALCGRCSGIPLPEDRAALARLEKPFDRSAVAALVDTRLVESIEI